jgi:geranylgeranyl reductase family protein
MPFDTLRAEVDVLVVGAGPGGSTAAFHLASHGFDVLVVERSGFPREKACGDGLTPRGVKQIQAMGMDPLGPGFERINGLRVYHGHDPVLRMPWPELNDYPAFGVVRTRSDLDQALAEHAVAAGARLWQRTEAVAPIVEAGWVTGATLKSTDEDEPYQVRAKLVIAADGAASRFGSAAGILRDPARPIGIAARRYYRTDRDLGPWMESWLEVSEKGKIMPGYGWVFPVSEGVVNVGAGLQNTFKNFKDVSARSVFASFMTVLPPDWEIDEEHAMGPLLSGPIPMGMNRHPAALPGLLLVGDAAGMVNPFNGEGIAFAMESGRLAADLAYGSLSSGRSALAQAYPTALKEQYGKYFAAGRFFVKLIGNPEVMRLSTKYGLPREGFMKFLLRVMSGLSDGREGDTQDKMIHAIKQLVPAA